jgi:hypothetical protein
MKGVKISVKLGPMEEGSLKLEAGAVLIELDAERGVSKELEGLIREATDNAKAASIIGKAGS